MFVRHFNKLPRFTLQTSSNISYSTATATALEDTTTTRPIVDPREFRTPESNTAAHTKLHEAKFYTIPNEQKKQLFSSGGLPRQYEQQIKTFAEACLMVRPVGLELLDYIKQTDFTRPVVRYVLYGENGTGKSLTMAHVLHYALQNDFLIVHVPWVANWMKRPKEIANTANREGYIDLPFDAAAWLVHFKTQNAKMLSTLNLKTSKDYVWSKREMTSAGSTLSELIEHGIARIKFATETIAALLSEIKEQATDGKCKVLVAIDGYNAFFHPETRILSDNKQRVTPDRVTLTQPFLDITNYNWVNGVCVLTVDKIAMTEGYMESYLPRYLLGKEGFEHLDPFVPIHVPNYSEKEFASYIKYYLDRNWIQKTEPGFDEQLKFMSNLNPYSLMQLTRSL